MNRQSCARVWFVAILLALVVSGCATSLMGTTKGRVSEGNYYSPLENFVLPLPTPMFGDVRIQDRNDAQSGLVSVLDDMGNNEGVTYVSLSGEAGTIQILPEGVDSVYRSFVYEYVLPGLFQPVSPQSKVVHEEFLDSRPDRAFFAIAVIPGASSLMDGKTGKLVESVRALLAFDDGKYMYMLHLEMNTGLSRVNSDSLTEGDLAGARSALKTMRASIRFQ